MQTTAFVAVLSILCTADAVAVADKTTTSTSTSDAPEGEWFCDGVQDEPNVCLSEDLCLDSDAAVSAFFAKSCPGMCKTCVTAEQKKCAAVPSQDTNPTRVYVGTIHDRLCVRKSIADKDWLNPDGIKIFEDPNSHSFGCMYDIPSCRNSGFDIFTDGAATRFRLGDKLNSQLTALLEEGHTRLAGTKGIVVKVTGAVATDPVQDKFDAANPYTSVFLECGKIEIVGKDGILPAAPAWCSDTTEQWDSDCLPTTETDCVAPSFQWSNGACSFKTQTECTGTSETWYAMPVTACWACVLSLVGADFPELNGISNDEVAAIVNKDTYTRKEEMIMYVEGLIRHFEGTGILSGPALTGVQQLVALMAATVRGGTLVGNTLVPMTDMYEEITSALPGYSKCVAAQSEPKDSASGVTASLVAVVVAAAAAAATLF